jgi:hypothetical protein
MDLVINYPLLTDVLSCPGCRASYLHHGTVTVYSRREDAEDIRKTWIDAEDGRVVAATMRCRGDNPSARRNAVAISFWCESCHQTNELTFRQHKGQTEVEWRNGGARCP